MERFLYLKLTHATNVAPHKLSADSCFFEGSLKEISQEITNLCSVTNLFLRKIYHPL